MFSNTKSCRYWKPGAILWEGPVPTSTNPPTDSVAERFRIGLAVNASPSLGFGHAVRCLRIARAMKGNTAIYPVSEICRLFFESSGFTAEIQDWKTGALPP